MEPREPENKQRRAPEHPLETDQQRRARPHERNERDRARRRTRVKGTEKNKTSKEMRQIEPGGGNVQSQQKIMLKEQSK